LEKPPVSSGRRSSSGFFDDDVDHLAVSNAQAAAAQETEEPAAPALSAGPDTADSRDAAHQQAPATGSKEADGMSTDGDNHHNAPEQPTGAQDVAQDIAQAPEPARVPAAAESSPASAGVLPNKAAEDDPRRWGDRPDSYDHDSWLQEQKPPHWG
jgi:hypothetical protein